MMQHKVIHKAITKSSATDNAPFGQRTTVCLIEVKNDCVMGNWKKVNCKKCLDYKGIVKYKQQELKDSE